jgi:oligopeptide/dipeptide ABC transporter ATP-binding protein
VTRLDVANLVVEFATASGPVRALDGAQLNVADGEAVGIVGESGSGKSTLGLTIGRLLPRSAQRARGDVLLDGTSVFELDDTALRALRRTRLAFVFQNPMSALDPTRRIGRQLTDVFASGGNGDERARVRAQLQRVGLDDTERILGAYPHMLSGGMAQRVAIAMAFATRPGLVVADEPTASIDAAIRERILELIIDLSQQTGATLLLLTHDLRSVARRCARVAVMYGGRVVEIGATEAVFARPVHPYTQALMRSAIGAEGVGGIAAPIRGLPPTLAAESGGCAFAPRCEWAVARCTVTRPAPMSVDQRDVLCLRAEETIDAAAPTARTGQ